MFWLFSGKKRVIKLEKETEKSFENVKKDFEHVGKWIKHLDGSDKRLFDIISELERDLSSVKDEIESLKEIISLIGFSEENKQLSKKQTAVYEQAPVQGVQKAVQTPVQTANLYEILQGLSANERLLVFTLLNAGENMKLSYEDLARLLGKERSTVRGQINSIKQKSMGLVQEIIETSGKKRVFVNGEIRQKLLKYARVRAKSRKKDKKLLKRSIKM